MSASPLADWLTISAWLVRESPPPMPSIWRMSGDPISDNSSLSRARAFAGRSDARNNGPFDVPARNGGDAAILERDVQVYTTLFDSRCYNGAANASARRSRGLGQ